MCDTLEMKLLEATRRIIDAVLASKPQRMSA